MNELYDYDSEGRADKKLETIISAEIERKSFKLALEILRNSIGINQIINLNNIDWCDLQTHQCLISACRKAAIDNFPLHDYAMGEIASVTDEYMIMYFENKYEYGMGENYNPNAREIVFQCFFGNPVAVPYRMCNNGSGDYIEERNNCFDALYKCGNY